MELELQAPLPAPLAGLSKDLLYMKFIRNTYRPKLKPCSSSLTVMALAPASYTLTFTQIW